MPKKKYLGVHQVHSGRWSAVLFAGRRQYHLGTWPTELSAAVGRDRAALFLKSHVKLNFASSRRKKPASPEDLQLEGRAAVLKAEGVARTPKTAVTRSRAGARYLGVQNQTSGTFLASGRAAQQQHWSAGCWPTAEKAAMARDRAVLFFRTDEPLNFPVLARRAGAASPLALRGLTGSPNPVRGVKVYLSDADVRALRERSATGASSAELASSFGVSESHAGRLTRGEARPAAGGPLRRKTAPKLTDRQVVAVRRAAVRGDKTIDIAQRFGISHAWVSQIAHGFARRDAGGPIIEDWRRRR